MHCGGIIYGETPGALFRVGIHIHESNHPPAFLFAETKSVHHRRRKQCQMLGRLS